MITCPMCDAVLDVEEEELDEGDELTCEECGETILVSGKEPLELKSAEESDDEDDEDFEYDEDDDEDDDDEEEEEEEEENW